MKRIFAIALAITMLILTVGCSVNSPPVSSGADTTSAMTESSTAGSNVSDTEPGTESTTDTTGTTSTPGTTGFTSGTTAPPETSTPESTKKPPETSEPSDTEKPPETSKPSETSKPTTDTTEEAKPPETSKTEVTTPPETSRPEETQPPETTKPEETTPPETSKPEETQPPKSAYEYPFDIEQIRRDCIAIAEGYGMKLDESLNKNNSSWANPDPATPNTQGARLKRLLSETIEYYTDDYREAMGLTPLHISSFNIYCEPTGDGGYLIYFLH